MAAGSGRQQSGRVTSAAASPALTDLGARRRAGEAAVAVAAAAPVRHVTQEFLDALNCRAYDGVAPGPWLRAVGTG